MNSSDYRCPHCGCENTRYVPNIYKEGHSTVTETRREVIGQNVQHKVITYADGRKEREFAGSTPIYGDVQYTQTYASDLSLELSPPDKPISPDTIPGAFSRTIGELFTGIGCLPFVVTFIFYIVCLIIYYIFDYKHIEYIVYNYIDGFFGFLKYSFIVIPILTVLYCIKDYGNKVRQVEQERANAKKNLDEYYAKLNAWKHSYLCSRCGKIFVLDK